MKTDAEMIGTQRYDDDDDGEHGAVYSFIHFVRLFVCLVFVYCLSPFNVWDIKEFLLFQSAMRAWVVPSNLQCSGEAKKKNLEIQNTKKTQQQLKKKTKDNALNPTTHWHFKGTIENLC